jgi:UDP-N-acetylglucosamine--N-acetylmuramyl-(pentapeptide) pyrophosphoryl-undecaprenol N-acetylglucosamine transferase
MTFALITGGGTGGHVYPGLALAEALVARGHPRESIHWVGSSG